MLIIKDTEPATRKRQKVSEPNGVKGETVISSKIKALVWVLAIFSLVNFPDALLLLHLSQENFTVIEVVGLYLLFNISYAALSFPAGLLADRIKPKFVFSFGLLLFAIAYGGLAITTDKAAGLVFVIIYGGFAATNDVVGKSWVSKMALANQQLAVQARLQGLTGLAVLVAGVWAGLCWSLGPGFGIVPLLISAISAIVAAGFVLTFKTEAY